ncbi:MAG: hypothetical protein A2X36_04850 [Elusimicrobia bacterium GWA2_69_24]|nr:MAG: hypothetical protein A2X36_04850 [Elusimicrobia bacterium GWA2_69_24]
MTAMGLGALLCAATAWAGVTVVLTPLGPVPAVPGLGLSVQGSLGQPLAAPSVFSATLSLMPVPALSVLSVRAMSASPVLAKTQVAAAEPQAVFAAPLPVLSAGDLVFLDLDCGALCDAIADSTIEQFGVSGPRLSHVGIVELVDGVPFVWEAWPGRGVSRVPLRFFLSRVQGGEGMPGGYYLGRLPSAWRSLGESAAARVKSFAQLPYDDDFAWGSPGAYCSKLVTLAYDGMAAFAPRPMYFGKEGSQTREVWRWYFAARGRSIPDGEPGVSPLGLFLAVQP